MQFMTNFAHKSSWTVMKSIYILDPWLVVHEAILNSLCSFNMNSH